METDPYNKSSHEPGCKLDAGKTLAGVLLDFGHERYLDAAMRHLLKHGQGETHDAESGLTHLSHAAWNLLAIAELDARGGK